MMVGLWGGMELENVNAKPGLDGVWGIWGQNGGLMAWEQGTRGYHEGSR